ncbi:hypothetical protein J2Z64_002266 [Oceanobacillus polygoni]|uniref:Uncharacterized protein n=1 Tax=Oceanobacillus polygoni TaxID=1235259 RepID=A0A9X1CCG1_9BACI|nr:hypothetical protein [Oceanobacillus polygoni]
MKFYKSSYNRLQKLDYHIYIDFFYKFFQNMKLLFSVQRTNYQERRKEVSIHVRSSNGIN